MQAMSEQEDFFVMRVKVQIDDAHLGGEHCGGRPVRASENWVSIIVAASVGDAGDPQ